ncbi:hypothetical protein, partial [Psychrobacter sp. SMN/5/1215-MNA-CIBAN-0208]|uniref:hypothetical protein n=1 Tax=Psychrobacter sp. SMN/5/1215-MNA-CIBAN-0208 TaxID=3140442 RepID=UPI00331C3251
IETQHITYLRSEQVLVDQINRLIELVRFKLERLSELASQIKHINQSLPTLNKEIASLDDLITSHKSDIQNTKLKKQDKQEHLTLLQKVAKLEDYILELEDGVP